VVYKVRRYFGTKSKGYNATMKRAVKEHPEYPLEIRDIFRNKRISSKRVAWKRVYAVTKKIFRAG
jgi:IS5 family transposase